MERRRPGPGVHDLLTGRDARVPGQREARLAWRFVAPLAAFDKDGVVVDDEAVQTVTGAAASAPRVAVTA
ncbi:MAG: hypothetical protein IT499_06130 [Rubrivivax sp.]|nr:hypothetical protein [Rubrivivax sp.]MCL4696075.1 hypothetical protein [Burkholderiaceae bacterium]